ncbi:hypothetical protein CPB84DRAFT_326614 [Gymnopilus junonius]|uniref:F-box domain-containing protein n=1 Tax=Gymnopilus junonius TaxID=109634 RepID=A0A9P5NEB3_GYMJU|nr:hypothetical protein CPB84DRAFT_326614 [Gymnopilus junonius]
MKANMLGDCNLIHHKLPLEVVSYIFQLCMPDTGFFYDAPCHSKRPKLPTPFVLGRVCKAWKQIAWSTPHLWTNTSVDANAVDLQEECRNVEEMLHRSGRMPLSIRITAYDRDTLNYPWYHRLIQLINEHSTRWHVLDLRVPGRHWCLFSGNSQPSSTLQVLRLGDTSPSNEGKYFRIHNATPSPEEVRIDFRLGSLMSVDIQWGCVINLELSTIKFDKFLNWPAS